VKDMADETKKGKEKEEDVEKVQKEDSDASLSVIERARAENERMERNLQRREELVVREEALAAEKMLSGTADAGQEPEKPKEDTDKEYADKALAGDMNG